MKKYSIFSDDEINLTDILNNIQEDTDWHNPYDQELREQESIENGDVESLKLCWAETYEGEIGTLALNHMRNIKNLAIAVITLSSRSAIKGGLNYELAFSIADKTILMVEHQVQEPEEVIELIHKTQLLYTNLVRDNKAKSLYNPLINKAKNYILKNIHDKINVCDIAKWCNVNPNYLSSIFHKHENKTLKYYILEEKINLCCNMLKYSDFDINRISTYYGFCSQSHFTKQFKQILCMTPAQYKKQYGKNNK